MNRIIQAGLIAILLACPLLARPVMTVRQEMLCERETIKNVMKQVVEFQTAAFGGHPRPDWKVGTFYSGVYAAYEATGDEEFYQAAKAWCEMTQWKLVGAPVHADNICTGQPFLDIYLKDKQDYMIADVKAKVDLHFQLKDIRRKEDIGNANWKEVSRPMNGRNLWWWCDALYMAPPVFARLYTATGDHKYLDKLDELYWDCTDFLFNKEEGLYWRDSGYFDAKTPGGKPVFWGRGNGWVYGGLIRTLDHIPDGDPIKQKFVEHFQKMTRVLVKYQQPDGLWRSSVNEPSWIDIPETSASSFYCFGLLAGINRGYLDRQTYLPAALKAWEGLLSCVSTDGRLGHAQLVDAAPNMNRPEDFIDYTHGAFLLAASEIYKMNLSREVVKEIQPPYEAKLIARNGAWSGLTDERMLLLGNSLLAGSVDSKGASRVDLYQLVGNGGPNCYQEYLLSSWSAKKAERHNPALLQMGDGRILAAYAQQEQTGGWCYRVARFTGPTLKWEAEQSVSTPALIDNINLTLLKSEKDRIYQFSISDNGIAIMVSDDNAATWQGPVTLMRGDIPQVRYVDNGTDRIDLLYKTGEDVYHVYYQGGNWYMSDGSLFKSMEQVKQSPLVITDGTVVYAGPACLSDLEYDKNGLPVAVFATCSKDNQSAGYVYSHWDSSTKKWVTSPIAFTRGSSAGSICIDPDNTSRVYISACVDPTTGKGSLANGGRWQIYQGETADNGATFAWKQLTFDAQVDNLKPTVPRRHGQKMAVQWLQGQDPSDAKFQSCIMGILEK